jgi:hypothetical protein
LIEILVAMFIFLIGCLGVLAVFPVVINNAGRVLGETRGNTLAQSAIGQITADCRVNFELPTTGSAAAVSTTTNNSPTTLVRQTPSAQKQCYFVTMLDGPGRGQSRFITADPAVGGITGAITVAPPWTSVNVSGVVIPWTGPGSLAGQTPNPFPNEHYSITRMGLPEQPLVAGQPILSTPTPTTTYYVSTPPGTINYTYGSFGLNRDLAVRSFVPANGSPPANGFFAGIANPNNGPPNGPIQVDPLVAYSGTAALAQSAPAVPGWSSSVVYSVGNMVSSGGTNYVCTVANSSAQPPNPNWVNAASVVLYDPNQAAAWPPPSPGPPLLSSNYIVRIVSGTGAGQVRTITGQATTAGPPISPIPGVLTVTPSWTIPPSSNPTAGNSVYEIGWANTPPTGSSPPQPLPPPAAASGQQNATWCAQLYPVPGAAASTGSCSGNTLTNTTAAGTPTPPTPPWTANQFQGKYVYIYGVPGAGQARAIVWNTAAASINGIPPYTLVVTPAFAPVAGSPNYVITESRGYVLITSGRARDRLFPIVWDAIDNTDGHLIVCAGTDFTALNAITAAQSGSQYNLQNATTFTVIGNWQSQLAWPLNSGTAPYAAPPYPSMPLILNAVPDGSAAFTNPILNVTVPISAWTPPAPPSPPFCPPWFNTMNTCAQTPPYRLALDQFNVLAQAGGTYTSEYSYGVIFSDSGTDASLPVRVDVFVWRNFDPTKDFVENQRPVGHMTGYIKRP